MLRTYEAIIRGDRIEWVGDAPDQATPLKVHVTVLEQADALLPSPRGTLMAGALNRLAQLRPFSEIVDPVAWQSETREDRPLPGRTEKP